MTEYFVILTLQRAHPDGRVQTTTFTSTTTLGPDATRKELWQAVFADLPSDWHGAPTLFFSAEPNRQHHEEVTRSGAGDR